VKYLKVSISVDFVAGIIRSLGKNYVTPKDLSEAMGISTKTAGRILRALESKGYVARYSNRAYRVLRGSLPSGNESHASTLVVRYPEDPPIPY
jgi:DNA-binding IclR family transcriptional regulator